MSNSEYHDQEHHVPVGAQTTMPRIRRAAPPPFPSGYGYGPMPMMWRLRRQWPIETKPFYLTSEFWAAAIAVLALGITAAADNSIDARFFWVVCGAIVVGYMLARGIAKSGTRSHADDPREHWDFGRSDDEHQHHHHADGH